MKQIKIGVDPVAEGRLVARAEQAGISVSEYVRALIARDQGGEGDGDVPALSRETLPNLARVSDELLPRIHELVTLNAVLVRALLAVKVGEPNAQRIQDLAEEKAAGILRRLPAGD